MKRNIITHAVIVVALLLISGIYFLPILQGKALPQGDLQKYEGMAKAQKDYHQSTGDYSTWCPSMFSGMPGYQITNSPQHSIFTPIKNVLTLQIFGRHNDMGILFLYLLGFYIALVALGVSPWLALLGGLAFGLGSYNIIIIEAGHITKAWAMAMMAPVLAGMMLCLKAGSMFNTERAKAISHLVWGGILFTIALGLQIALNHIQITFYTAIACVVMGVVYFIYSLKDKYFGRLLLSVGVLLVGVMLALACNVRHLFVNQEYMQYTMRGGSEITVTPQDVYGESYPRSNNANDKGLDINYAFSWSYGIGETYTLLVPGAYGGGSMEPVSKESASYSNFHQEKMPLYWGNQPFTSGPVYFGAIVIFLFIFGLIVVKGPERWWILIAALLAVMLSWGKNLMGFNGWIFDHLPLYNKFRTPSMSLVLANVLAVLMAVLGLKEVFGKNMDAKRTLRALYISAGSTVGIILIGLLLASGLPFSGSADQEMANQYGAQWPMIQSIFMQDRRHLFSTDSWRSIVFVVIAAALLWLYIKKLASNPKSAIAIIAALAIITVIDLQGVNSRYLNADNYVRNARQLEMQPAQYDMEIDQQAAMMGDHDYRVLNMAVNTFNDSKPSAFHNQVGGYSAAKLRRYQDLIDFYISYQINPNVLNMLNTRYYVTNQGQVVRNPDALGNAWFVREVKNVANPNEAIMALKDFNPATTAIFDEMDFHAEGQPNFDSTATIELEAKHPADLNTLTYHTHSNCGMWAVFSEIYYEPDWKCYVDGEPTEYYRANYVLRSMYVEPGDHTIEFRNEAPTLHKLDNITLIFSIVTILAIGGVLFVYYRRRKQE
ncbi:MAG: hypothetical protein MJZ67_05080 [Bacteroidales bacterium]|nr:hypothetical protein [Bacteroidales bacterium]